MSTVLGGSTAMMLRQFEQNLADAPVANIAADILTNDRLDAMQNKIKALKENRDSIYQVQAQVAVLEKNIETINTPDKAQLKDQVTRLTHLIKQGIVIDKNFSELETTLSELEAQHREMKKTRSHSPGKTSEALKIDNETFNKTISERTKDIDQLTAQFPRQHEQIIKTYIDISALPATKPHLKPLNVLEAEQQKMRPGG